MSYFQLDLNIPKKLFLKKLNSTLGKLENWISPRTQESTWPEPKLKQWIWLARNIPNHTASHTTKHSFSPVPRTSNGLKSLPFSQSLNSLNCSGQDICLTYENKVQQNKSNSRLSCPSLVSEILHHRTTHNYSKHTKFWYRSSFSSVFG